ncbi:hypothetical protein FIA58_005430 [Flavobacterium jejuense]|uniref:Lipocalin-like domain-containing protein n=1 Tax=Flavobacterium jejuense TaxID=1544455 RepID=A0ABX0INE0_9FLAO|nr:hypothetical protein [Flavobacterium jejuense]NHN25116.1 hypothetical protein [Flavobacterium jejuense]
MKKTLLYFICFVLLSCSESIQESDLQLLNGIWEIEKVVSTDNVVKEYKINEAVEQIQFEDGKGTRRKVRLVYNGNFLLNNIIQEFTVEGKENSFFILNKTEFSSWKEEIKVLTNEKIMLENEQGIQYYYKRRNDIKIGKDGKEI